MCCCPPFKIEFRNPFTWVYECYKNKRDPSPLERIIVIKNNNEENEVYTFYTLDADQNKTAIDYYEDKIMNTQYYNPQAYTELLYDEPTKEEYDYNTKSIEYATYSETDSCVEPEITVLGSGSGSFIVAADTGSALDDWDMLSSGDDSL
jgi:hypothetical protein